MLSCNAISLTQFRNYTAQTFTFNQKIIGIYGSNGSGKTNLLDAVYYLCFTKSYFSVTESQNMQQGFHGLRIKGNFTKEEETIDVTGIVRETGRKEFLWNDLPYTKFSEHIGRMPCVMIAPDDVSLITGGSEERRKFIDTLLSQLRPGYLQQLIDYNKILQQRNSFLKAAAEKNYIDENLVDVLDKQLCHKGDYIHKERCEFLKDFLPVVNDQYNLIAGEDDAITIVYESQLNQNSFEKLLKENRQRDLFLQRSSSGIHKDELVIMMHGSAFKHFASQGQRKTLLFALKLAEFFILKKTKGFSPILLLDDVFEKLDETRMQNLLSAVCSNDDAQVFITDTHKERLSKAFKNTQTKFQLINIVGA